MPGGSDRISPIRDGVRALGVCSHGGEGRARLFGCHDGDELALVGHVERIDAEQLAGRRHRRPHGQGRLLQDHGQVAVTGQLVADRAHPAPGRIAQPPRGWSRLEQVLHQPVERSGVRLDVGFEGEVASGQHDRGAVVAEGARGEHHVAVATRAAESRRPAGIRPTPAVEMYMPSAAPRSTTLVSPVTIETPAAAAASAMSATIPRSESMEKPSSRTKAADRASGRAPSMARSLTVPCTARWPTEPPGKRTADDVGVRAERQSLPRGQGDGGGVGLLGARIVGEGRQEHRREQRGGRLPAGAVGQRDDLFEQSGPATAEPLDPFEDDRLTAGGARRPAWCASRPCTLAEVSLHDRPQLEHQRILGFLSTVDTLGVHHQAVGDGVAGRHRPPVVPAEPDREQSPMRRLFEPPQYVAVTAGRESHGDVARLGMGDDLSGEDQVESDVIGQSGEHGPIVHQGDGRQGAPTRRAPEQIDRTFGVGRTAAIAEGEQPPPLPEVLGGSLARLGQSAGAAARGWSSVALRLWATFSSAEAARSTRRLELSRSSDSMKG